MVRLAYDAAGNVSAVSLASTAYTGPLASNITYAPFGPVVDLTYGNGLGLTQALDTAYRLTRQQVIGAFERDSAATLRGIEIDADVVIKGTKVDGVYSADPVKDPSAVKYDRLSYDEVIERKLGVMDTTAIVLCRDNQMPIRVFNMNREGALLDLVRGGDEGTLVQGE